MKTRIYAAPAVKGLKIISNGFMRMPQATSLFLLAKVRIYTWENKMQILFV